MNVYEETVESIKTELEEATGLELREKDLDKPPDPSLGYISTNIAFKSSEQRSKDPAQEAQRIAGEIDPENISEVNTKGPYINFKLDRSKYYPRTIKESKKPNYGSSSEGQGKTIIIDYSSVNIAKPFHIGHMRSTAIGQALKNTYEHLGYQVKSVNHLGDWGTQFGKVITAYLKWGDKEKLEENPLEYLYELYVKFHEEAEENSDLEDEAREHFKNLEQGKQKETELWEKFREISLNKLKQTYSRLNITFDSYKGEAHYVRTGKAKEMVKESLEKNIARKEEDGSIVIPLEEQELTNFLIRKKDQSTLYSTRDLAAAKDRWKNHQFHKNLYVVGSEQQLHFKQLFKSLELLGYDWNNKCEHVSYELVNLPEGSMSTREGKIVKLEDLLNEARERSLKAIKEKNPELEAKEETADEVGKAAVKFINLDQKRNKNLKFEWEKALDFEGDTGPYLQYAHTRANGIMNEVNQENLPKKTNTDLLTHEHEERLIKKLSEFPSTVKEVKDKKEPQVMTRYLLDLSHRFSDFYQNCQVKNAETKKLKKARIELVKAFKNTLANGLELLGINPLKEM